jgi:hypothetical protein
LVCDIEICAQKANKINKKKNVQIWKERKTILCMDYF